MVSWKAPEWLWLVLQRVAYGEQLPLWIER
jgi:hypothetical protein